METRTLAQDNLIKRLETGRALIVKRRWFFRAGDWANWAKKEEHRKQVGISIFFSMLSAMALLMVFMIWLLPFDLAMGIIQPSMMGMLVVSLVTASIFFLFAPLLCEMFLEHLRAEDRKNGWTAEIRSVLPDVPYYCWSKKALNKIISLLEKRKAHTVTEAVQIYVRAEYRKQQALGIIAGVFKWMDREIDQSIRRACQTNLPPMVYITWL